MIFNTTDRPIGTEPNQLQRSTNQDLKNLKTTLTDSIDSISITSLIPTWTASTGYVVGDIVKRNHAYYSCSVAHTSGTFLTDLVTNLYWSPLGAKPGDIKMSFQNVVDPGWLECNGALITASYEDLYSLCNTSKWCSYLTSDVSATVDVCTGANAISGGDYASYPKANAFDNDLAGATWRSSQVYTAISGAAYLGQSGLTRAVKKLRYKNHPTDATLCINSVKIQWSADNSTWTDIQTTAVSALAAAVNTISIAAYTPGATHYLRVLANANLGSGKAWSIGEMEMYYYSAISGGDLGWAYQAGLSCQVAEGAFAGSTTYWASSQASGSISGAAYIGYGPLTSVVRRIRYSNVIHSTGLTGKRGITSLKVEWSLDGATNWQTIQTTAVTNDEYIYNDFAVADYAPGASHYVRLLANAEPGTGQNWILTDLQYFCQVAIPDLRGEFVRGWDNGRGVDSGREIMGWQVDNNRFHRHSLAESSGSTACQLDDVAFMGLAAWKNAHQGYVYAGNTTTYHSGMSWEGSDSRPRNLSAKVLIKY